MRLAAPPLVLQVDPQLFQSRLVSFPGLSYVPWQSGLSSVSLCSPLSLPTISAVLTLRTMLTLFSLKTRQTSVSLWSLGCWLSPHTISPISAVSSSQELHLWTGVGFSITTGVSRVFLQRMGCVQSEK